jgi:hypothetical protein
MSLVTLILFNIYFYISRYFSLRSELSQTVSDKDSAGGHCGYSGDPQALI